MENALDQMISKNDLMFGMASLSPSVSDVLDKETYRLTADVDESTENHILERCLYSFIKDIEEIGLTLNVESSDYIDDTILLNSLINCMGVILPNGLYPILKQQSSMYELVSNLVKGSIGSDDCLVVNYLNELGALDGGIPHFPKIADDLDRLCAVISQTTVFSDYLKNLIYLVDEEKSKPAPIDDKYHKYQIRMRDIINSFTDAINLFYEDVDYEYLVRIRSFLIRDLSSAENYDKYSYLFLENEDTLPESLLSRYHDKWFHFNVSNRWAYDYYVARNIHGEIVRRDQMLIACFAYSLSNDDSSYLERVATLRDKYRDDYVDGKILSLFKQK